MTDLTVDTVIDDPRWLEVLPEFEDIAKRASALALTATNAPDLPFAVSILACNDARIMELNKSFRDKEGPTNVLSWPAVDLSAGKAGEPPYPPSAGPLPGAASLGDVAIARQTCEREAKDAGKPLKNHVMHLILHGCLHLLGYDHETPEDAELMEAIEISALDSAGIPDPYV